MNTIVTDTGFHPAEANPVPASLLELPSDTAAEALPHDLDRYAMIRIAVPHFADGRGFTLARLLRLKGYRGRLRATGHIIADQYAMARRSGFDEVEIDEALAQRQPEALWRARANWRAHDYQARLRG